MLNHHYTPMTMIPTYSPSELDIYAGFDWGQTELMLIQKWQAEQGGGDTKLPSTLGANTSTVQSFRLYEDKDRLLVNPLHAFIHDKILRGFVIDRNNEPPSNQHEKLSTSQNTIGFQCKWCCGKKCNKRAARSSIYPQTISGIYRSVLRFKRDHIEQCPYIPKHIMERYICIKKSSYIRGNKRYWVQKARYIGLHDTKNGIVYKQNKQRPPFNHLLCVQRDCTGLKDCGMCGKSKKRRSYTIVDWDKDEDMERVCYLCRKRYFHRPGYRYKNGRDCDELKKCGMCGKSKKRHSYLIVDWDEDEDRKRLCHLCKKRYLYLSKPPYYLSQPGILLSNAQRKPLIRKRD